MNILPMMITMRYISQAYKSYAWHAPQTWERSQIDPHDEIKNLAHQAGIRKDLKFYLSEEEDADNSATAFGNNSFMASDLAILVDSNMDILNKTPQCNRKARNFVLKHEFAHLINNDNFHLTTAAAIASIASLALGLVYMKPMFTSLFVLISARTAEIVYSRFMERRADKYAMEHSSVEEIDSFAAALKESLKRNSTLHAQDFAGKVMYSFEGNSNTDWEHDPLTVRLKAAEVFLQNQRV